MPGNRWMDAHLVWFGWVLLILARYIWYFDKLETSDYDSQSFNIFTGLLMTPHWSKHFLNWIRASQLSLLFWSAPGLLMIPHHWPKQQKLSPAKSSISSTGKRAIFKTKCPHNFQDNSDANICCLFRPGDLPHMHQVSSSLYLINQIEIEFFLTF